MRSFCVISDNLSFEIVCIIINEQVYTILLLKIALSKIRNLSKNSVFCPNLIHIRLLRFSSKSAR